MELLTVTFYNDERVIFNNLISKGVFKSRGSGLCAMSRTASIIGLCN